MYHFQDSIQDTKGNALTGYYVKVVDTGTGNLVDIYADDSLTPIVSVSAVDNAARVDSDGMADFWVASGTYHLDIYSLDALTLARRETYLQMIEPVSTDTGDARYLQKSNDLSDVGNVVTARTNLGATTVGANLFTLTNPSAITFPRYNADNTVSALTASAFRTAIGAGVGGGDLVSTNNLSDITSASTARTNLGVAIGSDVQAYDADLAAIAGISGVQGDLIYHNGTQWSRLAAGTTGNVLLTSGAGGNPAWGTAGSQGRAYEAGPPATVPTVASMTWINQGTSTAIDNSSGIVMTPQQDANVHMLKMAAPTAPYDIYCRAESIVAGAASTTLVLQQFGIVLRDGVNGDFLNVVMNQSRAAATSGVQTFLVAADYWTSPTAFSSTPMQISVTVPVKWVRVNVTSTTVTVYTSQDGRTWLQVGSESIATHVGAITEYGISVRGSSNNVSSNSVFSYFSTSAPT